MWFFCAVDCHMVVINIVIYAQQLKQDRVKVFYGCRDSVKQLFAQRVKRLIIL